MSPSTPSMWVYDSIPHRNPLPHHHRPSYPSPSGAMAIPGARNEVPPPPLPPPRNIGKHFGASQDPDRQWHLSNSDKDTGFGGPLSSVKHGSSLMRGAGGGRGSIGSRSGSVGGHARDVSTSSLDRTSSPESDEDRSGQSRPALNQSHRFSSERQLGQKTLESSSQAYDKRVLSMIGGPNTPNTPTRTTAPPLPPANTQDSPGNNSFGQPNGQLKPLSVPDRLQSSLDSPVSRWPPSGTLSPGYAGFRSPVFDPADARRPRYGSLSTSGILDESVSSQHRGSYDHSIFSESEFGMEESGMRDLNINDRSPAGSDEYQAGSKGGLKRRASSPPSEAARDDRPTAAGGGNTDLYHRRSAQMLVSRNSPASRFQASQGSPSAASSLSQRTAASSFASSYAFSTAASSLASYGGEQRHSPSALSPSAEADQGPPYAARSLDPSPRGSLSRPHQRGLSESEHSQIRKMSTDAALHSRQNSVSGRLPGAYICECCPKKPKKFDSDDELRLHELEKQYTCQYCPNRFKNKNEAERHQNSLHLRRHSWSCAALHGVQAAFHPSPSHSAAADVCGYCGEEFPNNPANWDARSEHLNHVHKFGECNQAKKFFRADHFRQHLKHSHAGTSGKWTNMLENACMKDEPPPKERVGSVGSISSAITPLAPKPGVIDEVHDES